MGVPPQTQSSPHQYSQALQLKLYQAFIFSIPILFSIILFLLFYLFYLKRRAASLISSPSRHVLPVTAAVSRSPSVTYLSSPCEKGLKGELSGKLPTIVFNEEVKATNSQCCVCLGDYEMKEELVEVPPCRHVFHADCIALWLHANSTCPLCRGSVVISVPTCSHAAASPLPLPRPSSSGQGSGSR
ncbi:hypothetical protein MLD38_038605 [Melastoma candidum]|uniref:Uncharacterized protein n=1 Tax=Melastoma candidum TaxID=119954 RepID=A0ACB9KZR4_9MYRT|nr:hypothetical protein MLD38_038605 [Melastoma candidum]